MGSSRDCRVLPSISDFVNQSKQHTARAHQRLKVAVVTETFPPEVNGVAATIAAMVRGLLARGHDVEVVRPRQFTDRDRPDRPICGEILVAGLPIPGYPSLRFGVPSTGRLIDRWRSWRPDVVQVVTEGPLGWSTIRAARALGIPCASEYHTNFDAYCAHYSAAWLHRPIAAYLRSIHQRTAVTMVPTKELARALASDGYDRLAVVSRGVDTQRFDPGRRNQRLRESWGAADKSLVVMLVSRIAPEKNLPLLFTSFDRIHALRPDAKLVLVGDGPARARLQRQYPEHIFAGTRRGEHLSEHYASADIFLFPSLTETFGNVLTEAMASGLAVVAFDYAAAREHIRHNVNGIVAPFGDERSFAERVCTLVGDERRIERLRQAARATAETIDWARVLDTLEDTLRRVASGYRFGTHSEATFVASTPT